MQCRPGTRTAYTGGDRQILVVNERDRGAHVASSSRWRRERDTACVESIARRSRYVMCARIVLVHHRCSVNCIVVHVTHARIAIGQSLLSDDRLKQQRWPVGAVAQIVSDMRHCSTLFNTNCVLQCVGSVSGEAVAPIARCHQLPARSVAADDIQPRCRRRRGAAVGQAQLHTGDTNRTHIRAQCRRAGVVRCVYRLVRVM